MLAYHIKDMTTLAVKNKSVIYLVGKKFGHFLTDLFFTAKVVILSTFFTVKVLVFKKIKNANNK